MRLADAEVCPRLHQPLRHGPPVHHEIEKLLKDKQDETRERNQEIGEGVFTAPWIRKRRPCRRRPSRSRRFLSFAPLETGRRRWHCAERYDKGVRQGAGQRRCRAGAGNEVNAMLIEASAISPTPRAYLAGRGSSTMIYAPGFYTGLRRQDHPRRAARPSRRRNGTRPMPKSCASAASHDEAALIDRAPRRWSRPRNSERIYLWRRCTGCSNRGRWSC